MSMSDFLPAPREPMICLHCSGSSGRQWDPYLETLREHHRVWAPDLLGASSPAQWPVGTRVSLDDEARALAPLLAAAPAHLLGHSYGGAVALQMALRWPERVLSLTLYEPVRFSLLLRDAHVENRTIGQAVVAVGHRIGLEVLSGALDAAALRFVDHWSGAGAWQQLGAARQDAIRQRMPKVHAEFKALFADPVPPSAWRELAMPVRLIGGTRSPLASRRLLDLLEQQLPDVTRITLDGLGHMGPVQSPRRVLEAITRPQRLHWAQAA
jgi:pimeloyl-ACP methyl ester carboxylesterase